MKRIEIVGRLAKQALEWQATLPKEPIEEFAGKVNFLWPMGPDDLPPARKTKKKP